MPNWLLNFLTVLAFSKRTQWALLLGFLSFIGIQLWGDYALADFQLTGPATAFTDVIKQKLAKRYDKIAWWALFSFLAVAFRFYKKDRDRFL